MDAGNRADPSWAGVHPLYVVGYELAGRTQAAGEDADWRPGELVWGLLPVRGTRWGTYAELVTLDAALVAPRPPASARSRPPRSASVQASATNSSTGSRASDEERSSRSTTPPPAAATTSAIHAADHRAGA